VLDANRGRIARVIAADRPPAVAGQFYPSHPTSLAREVERWLNPDEADTRPPTSPLAVMAPHAGYRYSGRIAGRTYRRVVVPPRVVVLCPNHTGQGAPRAVWTGGNWLLPGAHVPIDEGLAMALTRTAGYDADRAAHEDEHSAEVQLPFLRARQPELRLTAVCLKRLPFDECRALGLGLARAIRAVAGPEGVLIVASSDMSHRIPADLARKLDFWALERVLALDPRGLYDVVTKHDISMCGFIPTTVALVAASELGARATELVAYGSSGDVTGDSDDVVGYAGVIIA
jgi:MEMO1 family protein